VFNVDTKNSKSLVVFTAGSWSCGPSAARIRRQYSYILLLHSSEKFISVYCIETPSLFQAGIWRNGFCHENNSLPSVLQITDKWVSFLGAFEKLRKTIINFVMPACLPVCLSVRPSKWNNSDPLDGFSWNLILYFENLRRKFKFY